MLPSDINRQIQNLVQVGKIVAIDLATAPGLVRVEIDEGVHSDWMPYAFPFVGNTWIWCAPAIGMKGTIKSIGGEDDVCRFFPNFFDESNYPYLTESDFKIHLKNGDFIHHNADSGTLTINSTAAVTVNTQKAEVNAPIITLNGDTTVTKTLTVQGFTSLNGGFSMNAGFARSAIYQAMSANYSLMSSNVRNGVIGTINIPIIVNAEMTYNVDPILHGVPYLSHAHTDVKSGGDTTGGVDQ
ncbi:phage baseplate assembly protein V [Wohlfahrtiimonas larvae]|uniref:Gp5/Type VI secretion system Vgr protein OB-fold domain-containing protein n=1 Tax=Wohlfahrtiimonas larvae TaxID=1157986 RepID=A0ABP9MK43_9GAMM